MSILKLKDSQGNWVGVPTIKGNTGNGISSAVLNNDYTLTLTFTDGTTYTTPSIRGEKGEQGEPATDMDIHICSASEYDSETRIPTIVNPDDKTFYLVPTEDGTSPDLFTEWVYVNNAWEMFGSASVDLDGYLTDVQINGTSIVSNGVANVPIASDSVAGVIKTSSSNSGLFMLGGALYINPASSTEIKRGENLRKPIASKSQHESTFYGLAKAAGHDEKNSSLPVGTYTPEAKASIKSMLGVQDGMVVNATLVSGTQYTIDSTYDAIKTALSAGKTVVVMTEGVPQPYVGNVQLYDEWYLAFGVSTIYDNIATLTGFMIPQTYQNVAIWTAQNTTIPQLNDVQINGQSIVVDGVANVPIATDGVLGLVQTNWRSFGVIVNSAGQIYIGAATSGEIKAGTASYKPIVARTEHEATFYGLAKAAGADEKDSTLPVGQFTDNAKDKIQTMLGITPLIASHETDPFESAHVIGELFIINGKLYRAKTALAVGEYINEGTNVEVVDVAEVLDDTYVKNTDYATSNKAGIVKTDVWYATGLVVSNGILYIAPASDAYIKEGNNLRTPIVPRNQHQSVFYGLAKASGDTTQSASDNAVGTYTDEAKIAIKTMLGVHDTYDSFIEEIDGTDVTITGQPSYRYNCGELYSLTVTPPSSGTIDIRFTSGSTPTVLTLPQTVKMPEWWVEVEANTIYEMCITDGIYCGVMSWAV